MRIESNSKYVFLVKKKNTKEEIGKKTVRKQRKFHWIYTQFIVSTKNDEKNLIFVPNFVLDISN